MDRVKLGKSVISFVIAASAIVSTLVDWNESHLFNPAWHGHAKFHDALMLCLLAGISIVGLWQLWRDSKEPEVGIKIAALIPVTFWTPSYYISATLCRAPAFWPKRSRRTPPTSVARWFISTSPSAR